MEFEDKLMEKRIKERIKKGEIEVEPIDLEELEEWEE